jgi:hypothetical protein
MQSDLVDSFITISSLAPMPVPISIFEYTRKFNNLGFFEGAYPSKHPRHILRE